MHFLTMLKISLSLGILALMVGVGAYTVSQDSPPPQEQQKKQADPALEQAEKSTSTPEKGQHEENIATTTLNAPSQPETDEPAPPTQQPSEPSQSPTTTEESTARTTQGQNSSKTQLSEEERADFGDVNTAARPALANVLCSATSKSPIGGITGSGIFIEESGVILTNAHIGQYILLADHPEEDSIRCSVRTGNPTDTKFDVELLYVSPSWVQSNAHRIDEKNPRGTGEFDFALLKVDAPETTFSTITLPDNPEEAKQKGDRLLVAGYPAGFLSSESVAKEQYSSSAVVSVEQRYTFGRSTIDLLSFGGNVVAQQGASGGPAVDADSTLAGVIVTSTRGETTEERILRAITIGHINRTILAEVGRSLRSIINGDIDDFGQRFRSVIAPDLRSQLIKELNE